MSKPKIYEYEGRTFEVEVYNEAYGLISIYVNEVIRPKRKFFGRTRSFYYDHVVLNQYPSIDTAVREVIVEGLKREKYDKSIEKKFVVDYDGTNPWGQSYDNQITFNSEEEADAFIQKSMKEDEMIYQAFKTVITSYHR